MNDVTLILIAIERGDRRVLGISVATAERHFAYAKAWLHCEMARGTS